MNIRKIIKEEMDSFDWIKDAPEIPETEDDLIIGQVYYTQAPHDDDHWNKYIYDGRYPDVGEHRWSTIDNTTMTYTSKYTQKLLKNKQLTNIRPTDGKPIMYESNDFDWVGDVGTDVLSCHQISIGMKIIIGNSEYNPNREDDLTAEVLDNDVDDDGVMMLVMYDDLNVEGHNGGGRSKCNLNNCWYVLCKDFPEANISIIRHV